MVGSGGTGSSRGWEAASGCAYTEIDQATSSTRAPKPNPINRTVELLSLCVLEEPGLGAGGAQPPDNAKRQNWLMNFHTSGVTHVFDWPASLG